VQGVRWERVGIEPTREHRFFYVMENENDELCRAFFVHWIIIPEIKRVAFNSVRMSYIMLTGCWCHIIVLDIHAPVTNQQSPEHIGTLAGVVTENLPVLDGRKWNN
jgi:hypothetical protein